MSKEQILHIVKAILKRHDGCCLDTTEEVDKVANELALGLSGDIDFWANFDLDVRG